MMSYTLVKGGSMGSWLEEEQKLRRYSGSTLTSETAHFWYEKVKRLLETIPFHSGECSALKLFALHYHSPVECAV